MTDDEKRLLSVIERLAIMATDERDRTLQARFQWPRVVEPEIVPGTPRIRVPETAWHESMDIPRTADLLKTACSLLEEMLVHGPGGPDPFFVRHTIEQEDKTGVAFEQTKDWQNLRNEVRSFLTEG
jgi:hypothetical protein